MHMIRVIRAFKQTEQNGEGEYKEKDRQNVR